MPRKAVIVSIVVLLAIAGFAVANNRSQPRSATTTPAPAQPTTQGATFPTKTPASPPPTAAAITKQINAKPYYPTDLPTTFHSNNDTQLVGKNTVYYSYSDDKGNQYYVTQQPMPANFDYQAFKGSLKGAQEFSVPIGSAMIGTVNSELLGGIRTTNNLWILVGASSANVQTQLETLMHSLQAIGT